MWTSLEAQKLKDVIWIHVRKDLAKSCNFPHKVATFYIMGQFGADWGDGAPGRGRLNTFWVFYGLKTFPIWMLKVPACQTVCPVLGGWSRDWVPILWLRRGCQGLPGGSCCKLYLQIVSRSTRYVGLHQNKMKIFMRLLQSLNFPSERSKQYKP